MDFHLENADVDVRGILLKNRSAGFIPVKYQSIKCIAEIKCYNSGIILRKSELEGTLHCL